MEFIIFIHLKKYLLQSHASSTENGHDFNFAHVETGHKRKSNEVSNNSNNNT